MPGAVPVGTQEYTFILISIPIHIVVAYIPWLISLFGHLKIKTPYDNANPRLYLSSLENDALSGNPNSLLALRCYSCHLNSLETVACWSAAPFISLLFSGVPLLALCVTAIHMGLRVIYMCLYCFSGNKIVSYLRTVVFWAAWCCPLIMLLECVSEIGI